MPSYLDKRSGLQVVEYGNDEAGIQRELSRYDDTLILDREPNQEHGCWQWFVVKQRGDQDAIRICTWQDEYGNPLPLSSRLVDHVNALREGSRAPQADPLTHNDRLIADANQEASEAVDELSRELVTRLRGRKTHLLPRGLKPTPFSRITRVE